MHTYVGWPGSVHNARIFSNSDLYAKGESGELMPNRRKHINNVDVPVTILGDAAYPMLTWIIKPYPGTGTLSRKQCHFNYRLSQARKVVECAFGRLKGRWRCLLKRNDCELNIVSTIVNACCILHNLCVRCMVMDLLRSGSWMKSFLGHVVHCLHHHHQLRHAMNYEMHSAITLICNY